MIPAEMTTARLRLRPVAAMDEAVVVASLNDLGVTGWLSVVPYPYSPADFRRFQTTIALPGVTFAIEDAAGFAGIVGLENRTLGYWFCARAQGLGYATEAARAALAALFAVDPASVASGYFEGNARSANVLRKLGFLETGRGLKRCLALDRDRPYVDLMLRHAAFVAAQPAPAP